MPDQINPNNVNPDNTNTHDKDPSTKEPFNQEENNRVFTEVSNETVSDGYTSYPSDLREQPYVSPYPSETIQTNTVYTQPTTQVVPEQPVKKHTKKDKKKRNGWIPVAIISMVCAVACAGMFIFSVFVNPIEKTFGPSGNVVINQQQTPSSDNSETLTTDETGKLSSEQVVQKVLPSVVQIEATNQAGISGGSGVIMSEDGYIITNAHVVEDARSITVTTNDKNEHQAELIAYDSESDVGIIKIEGTFTPATFGDSSKVVPGEEVLAIGTPYSSDLFQTVTKGVVSAKRDSLTFSSLGLTINVIQHDAAINSGNSGGPLVNMYGQVIGINSVKISGLYENLSFALQINNVLSVASDLISKGAVEKPVIGITGRTESGIRGVLVVELTEGGAAKDAGIQVNDVITKFNDIRIRSIEELTSEIRKMKIGDQINLSVIRDGEMLSFTLDLRSSL